MEPLSIDQMKVFIFNVVLILFPKTMQLLLQNLITPRGLRNKYNNRDLKLNLTESEKSEMEKLPKMTDFTIELCYKIIRFENLVPEPSSQWEILPDENHQEITDDIKRIVFITNDVFNKLGEDVSDKSYETFKGKVEGIVARIDSYLEQESCKHCFEEVIALEAQLDICLKELQKLREIHVTNTTTPTLLKMEIQNGERFARIGWVIIDIFPKILRAVIQTKIAADVLYTHCSTQPYWSRFSYEEQSKLKSLKSSNTYDPLDIPLIYRLLRQFSLIKEPTNGWGQPPNSSDITAEDDIERIRILRNNFAHRSNINTEQSEFDDTYCTFKDICRRMDVYFSHDCASGYENDVSRKETTPMDYQLIQKYQRSLQELENIKLRFIESPVKFYWGEAVEFSLKNLRQVYKDEKGKRKGVTDTKLHLQIVVQNIEDDSAISRLVHKEFKDEINTGLTSIQLIKVSKGSIICHVDIPTEALCTEEIFRLKLVQFVQKVLQTGRLSLPTVGSVDVVLVQEDEYTKMQLFMQESTPQLCFDFEMEKSEFETDTKLKSKLGETVTNMLKHSNGRGQISDVSATISSGSFGEIASTHSVFVKTEPVDEITEAGSEVKKNIHDIISLTPISKPDPDRLRKSDFQAKKDEKEDSTSIQMVKMEITDEGKYEEIFFNVENLKCLLKLKGLPDDLQLTEIEEKSPVGRGNQLLYVEWTMECPNKWNVTLIASTINEKLAVFSNEISVDYVYTETNNNLVVQTTTHRYIFRSLSSIEFVFKNLIDSIMNVCSLKSNEPEELCVSALIMSRPDEKGEFSAAEFIKDVKKEPSMIGLKDNIRRLNQALSIKEQTIQRLDRALTKREEEMVQEDEFDHEYYDSDIRHSIIEVQKYQLPFRYKSEEKTRKTSKTEEIERSGEPEQKKRKTVITSYIGTSKDARKTSNQSASKILVDVKQALQKLGEIQVVDFYIEIYNKYLKDLNNKWLTDSYQNLSCNQIRPKDKHAILDTLSKEKRKRANLIARLMDVIHNQHEFTTTNEAYRTDIRFLDVQIPATKCNYCQTDHEIQISSYCKSCEIFICNNCVKNHRMNNKNHAYYYQLKILREYKEATAWTDKDFGMIDIKCMHPDMIVTLKSDSLCIYNLTGSLINTHKFRTTKDNNCRIACINDCKIAVVVPNFNLIHIVTIVSPIATKDLVIYGEKKMTGGITCRNGILYVAFSDAIRSMDLSGKLQRVVDIPNVYILHYVNNDKMLCVYSKKDSDKTMSFVDFTKGKVYDFLRFPFHPESLTTDAFGNIIFVVDGVIWQGDSDGNNLKIIISLNNYNLFKRLTYNKDSNMLVTLFHCSFRNIQVYKKLE